MIDGDCNKSVCRTEQHECRCSSQRPKSQLDILQQPRNVGHICHRRCPRSLHAAEPSVPFCSHRVDTNKHPTQCGTFVLNKLSGWTEHYILKLLETTVINLKFSEFWQPFLNWRLLSARCHYTMPKSPFWIGVTTPTPGTFVLASSNSLNLPEGLTREHTVNYRVTRQLHRGYCCGKTVVVHSNTAVMAIVAKLPQYQQGWGQLQWGHRGNGYCMCANTAVMGTGKWFEACVNYV